MLLAQNLFGRDLSVVARPQHLGAQPPARRVLNMEFSERHDEMATPSKPAQKTARAVEGPRAGAAGNQARVHGERRRGAELDRDLCLGTRPPPVWSSQVNAVRCLLADAANAAGNVRAGRPRSDHRKALALAAAQQP